jgi:thiosulfate/3-mercaptopyruvate sulfurtransferase
VLADALASPAPVVAYCAGGVLASADALALALLGRDDVSVYDGSLNEWAADEAAPLVITA